MFLPSICVLDKEQLGRDRSRAWLDAASSRDPREARDEQQMTTSIQSGARSSRHEGVTALQLYIQPRAIRTSLRYLKLACNTLVLPTILVHYCTVSTKIVQSVYMFTSSTFFRRRSCKQLTSWSAPALLHSLAGRISVKDNIPTCSPGDK